MNKLGFGLLRFPLKDKSISDDYDWDLLEEMVDHYLSHGGRYFDTCYTYLGGASEEAVRRLLAARYPRDAFMVAEKLPGYRCHSYEDCHRFYEEEKRRCGLDFFDVFMLHWLNGDNYEIAKRYDEFRFLKEIKAEGGAKRIGFSYHDSAELLDQILTEHPELDLVQLQINYLDWESAGVQSKACYEVCVKHGKKVIVMEPVKGGVLADLPEQAMTLLAQQGTPGASAASDALRFAASLPQVKIVLSGMSTPEQMEDNLRSMTDFRPITDDEQQLLAQCREIINAATAVPCTSCKYCLEECPISVKVPAYFGLLNLYRTLGKKTNMYYERAVFGHAKASECLKCGKCEKICPQHIRIRQHLEDFAEIYE